MVLKKSLRLMKALAMGNDMVQMRIFERLNTLLKIKVVESDLAVALKEVMILMGKRFLDCLTRDFRSFDLYRHLTFVNFNDQ